MQTYDTYIYVYNIYIYTSKHTQLVLVDSLHIYITNELFLISMCVCVCVRARACMIALVAFHATGA